MSEVTTTRTVKMTGSDLIVVAPWVIFGLGLAFVYVRLRASRRRRSDDAREAECPQNKAHTRR
jgi:hypothetical protein